MIDFNKKCKKCKKPGATQPDGLCLICIEKMIRDDRSDYVNCGGVEAYDRRQILIRETAAVQEQGEEESC